MSSPVAPEAEAWPPFIGVEVDQPYEGAEVVIVPIPYEATTTYRKGCQQGPQAILRASDQLEYYDVELGCEPCFRLPLHTHAAIASSHHHPDLAPEVMVQQVQSAVEPLLRDGKWVIALGGEHGITAGVVAAYQQVEPEPFTVVQIDAHGDLRDEYEGSRYNHACVMRRILDLELPILPIGLRSFCREEAELIAARSLTILDDAFIAREPDWIEQAIRNIPTDSVFITIDLDGLSPALLPGVGTPQPGGLTWEQITQLLRRLFASRRVLGCDVMELAPLSESVVSEFVAAKLVYKLVGYQALSPHRRRRR